MSRSILLVWMLTCALSEAMIFYPPFPPPGQYHEPPPRQPAPPAPPSHIPQRPTYNQQGLLSLLQLYLNGYRAPQYVPVPLPLPPQVITLAETEAEGGVMPPAPAQQGQHVPDGGALMEGQPTGNLSHGSQVQHGTSLQHGVQLPQGVQLHRVHSPHGAPLAQGPQLLHSGAFLPPNIGAPLPPGFQLPHGASLAGLPSGIPNTAGELGNLGGLVIGSETGMPQSTVSSILGPSGLPPLPPPVGFRRATVYNLQNNVPNNPIPIAQIRARFYERLCYQTPATMTPMMQSYIPGFNNPFMLGDMADPPACSCIPYADCESFAHRFINEKTKDECGSTLTGFACCCEEPPLIGK